MGTDITPMALRQQYWTRFNHIARLQHEALASGLDPKDLDITKSRYSPADTVEALSTKGGDGQNCLDICVPTQHIFLFYVKPHIDFQQKHLVCSAQIALAVASDSNSAKSSTGRSVRRPVPILAATH
jgi:hypothetical protein